MNGFYWKAEHLIELSISYPMRLLGQVSFSLSILDRVRNRDSKASALGDQTRSTTRLLLPELLGTRSTDPFDQ